MRAALGRRTLRSTKCGLDGEENGADSGGDEKEKEKKYKMRTSDVERHCDGKLDSCGRSEGQEFY